MERIGSWIGKPDRSAFVELDARLKGMEAGSYGHLKANLVIPQMWDAAIEKTCSWVPGDGPGILVFGSALNLLLFSPTCGTATLARMKKTVEEDKRRTYLFSVSITAKKEQIAELEAVADNLITSHSTKCPFRLFIRILRMKDTTFTSEKVEVPLKPETLAEVKEIADHSRKRVIPMISKI